MKPVELARSFSIDGALERVSEAERAKTALGIFLKGGAPMHVAIVDDEPVFCRSLASFLQYNGFDFSIYYTGSEFLASLPCSFADVALIDVCLPDINGIELVKQVLARKPDLTLFVITGHGDVPTATDSLKAGAVEFVEKPFSPQELIAKIDEHVAKKRDSTGDSPSSASAQAMIQGLTEREKQIADLVLEGMKNKEIAERLGIHVKTVESHRANLKRRLGVRSTVEMVKLLTGPMKK